LRSTLARGAQGRELFLEVFRKHLPMERTVGVHLYVTAPGIQTRMFAPLFGVPEDPGDRQRQRHADRAAGAARSAP
jgi:hypothetical protein